MPAILLPTDFSESSKNASLYAVEIAKKQISVLHLLHVYNVMIYDPNIPAEMLMNTYAAAEESASAALKQLSNELKQKDVVVTSTVNQGMASDEIVMHAKSLDCSLIVMGTTGESGLLEKIIGSTTGKVIENSKIPVLAIPTEANFSGIKNIAYATDFTEKEGYEIERLKQFAKTFDAEITILHICGSEEEMIIEEREEIYLDVKNSVNYEKLSFELIENKDTIQGIENYINSSQVDIIAMSTHKHGILSRIFNTSLTQRMLYHTRIPLLALHRND